MNSNISRTDLKNYDPFELHKALEAYEALKSYEKDVLGRMGQSGTTLKGLPDELKKAKHFISNVDLKEEPEKVKRVVMSELGDIRDILYRNKIDKQAEGFVGAELLLPFLGEYIKDRYPVKDSEITSLGEFFYKIPAASHPNDPESLFKEYEGRRKEYIESEEEWKNLKFNFSKAREDMDFLLRYVGGFSPERLKEKLSTPEGLKEITQYLEKMENKVPENISEILLGNTEVITSGKVLAAYGKRLEEELLKLWNVDKERFNKDPIIRKIGRDVFPEMFYLIEEWKSYLLKESSDFSDKMLRRPEKVNSLKKRQWVKEYLQFDNLKKFIKNLVEEEKKRYEPVLEALDIKEIMEAKEPEDYLKIGLEE